MAIYTIYSIDFHLMYTYATLRIHWVPALLVEMETFQPSEKGSQKDFPQMKPASVMDVEAYL